MKAQIVQDSNGNNSGVFIPMNEWNIIKSNYPDIENIGDDIPEWHKKILDERMYQINHKSDDVLPIEILFDELDKD